MYFYLVVVVVVVVVVFISLPTTPLYLAKLNRKG